MNVAASSKVVMGFRPGREMGCSNSRDQGISSSCLCRITDTSVRRPDMPLDAGVGDDLAAEAVRLTAGALRRQRQPLGEHPVLPGVEVPRLAPDLEVRLRARGEQLVPGRLEVGPRLVERFGGAAAGLPGFATGLKPAAPAPLLLTVSAKYWSEREDLNLRPLVFQFKTTTFQLISDSLKISIFSLQIKIK
ncbi:hypothetical protein ABIC08_006896 [Bradyrhizobium sp. RT9b]|uniref:hypothetical protein n=1 Tax=unclassified Bradyrhizobium TaxID=2631580 RepID=UPI0033945879